MAVEEDLTLVCKDCGRSFLFSAAEQDYFRQQGFRHQPERCRDCRRVKRREMEAFRRLAKGPTAVVCDDCGKATSVPFVPYLGRPVYCPSCYKSRHVVLPMAGRTGPSPHASSGLSSGS